MISFTMFDLLLAHESFSKIVAAFMKSIAVFESNERISEAMDDTTVDIASLL